MMIETATKELDTQNQRKVTINTEPKVTEQETVKNDTCNGNNNETTNRSFKHARITFETNEPPKRSVMERLGKRRMSLDNINESKKQNMTNEHDKKSSPVNKMETRRNKSRNDKDRVLQFEKPREVVNLTKNNSCKIIYVPNVL